LLRPVTGKDPLQLRFPFALWAHSMIQKICRELGVCLSQSAVAPATVKVAGTAEDCDPGPHGRQIGCQTG